MLQHKKITHPKPRDKRKFPTVGTSHLKTFGSISCSSGLSPSNRPNASDFQNTPSNRLKLLKDEIASL